MTVTLAVWVIILIMALCVIVGVVAGWFWGHTEASRRWR